MSLISSASPWTNDNTSRKRVSTMQKTVKLRPYMRDEEDKKQTEFIPTEGNRGEYRLDTVEEVQTKNEVRIDRVSEIIEKMTNIEDSDSSGMADFKPLANPMLNNKKTELISNADHAIPNPHNELQMPVPMLNNNNMPGNQYSNVATGPLGGYSNYQTTYEPSKLSAGGRSTTGSFVAGMDNKMIEKLNYMIHLLENQEHEKTANITEEFILYTFLGVFVIFVLDSFARSGKYVR